MLAIVKVKTFFDNIERYYLYEGKESLQKGSLFVGSTYFGEDIVEVVCPKLKMIADDDWNTLINGLEKKNNAHFSFEPKLLRSATDADKKKHQENTKSAEEYRAVFLEKIKIYELSLQVIKLYYTLQRDRLICIYTANSRVDFRLLIRDLGSTLKQRIELFQIPMFTIDLQGCGSCGRELCCASFACSKSNKKSTNLKQIGCCGRSKCCVSFE